MACDPALLCQLNGYRLATAEILYHLPDHPGLLQSYVWQDYDIAPDYPALRGFLEFWTRELDGPLHSVKIADKRIISVAEMGAASMFRIH